MWVASRLIRVCCSVAVQTLIVLLLRSCSTNANQHDQLDLDASDTISCAYCYLIGVARFVPVSDSRLSCLCLVDHFQAACRARLDCCLVDSQTTLCAYFVYSLFQISFHHQLLISVLTEFVNENQKNNTLLNQGVSKSKYSMTSSDIS